MLLQVAAELEVNPANTGLLKKIQHQLMNQANLLLRHHLQIFVHKHFLPLTENA